ncbi:TP53-binding protein 1 isoform X1 [Strongylocentrotus purpuratus]|uniref:BRCT domain-containing protein n=1 Tax=Strongylocentrotus purpuratus TaxID=7668 RepID=A0A7M7N860_STRPU|nr:TP53-binding protein 1 isoform X1 [Strongylocentrotus purpuratus]XP_030832529.1 TP53-binding protein 1 isoform X1 [Strongylocentrotus purpuratus]
MDLPSQDPSDPSQLDGGLPEVSSTPCFIVLDSQAEGTEAERGEESVTEARARRLKQLEELTKNQPTEPVLEMEFGGGIQRSGDKEDDKKESTRPMTSVEEIEVKAQTSKNDEASSEEEEEDEEEENEVPSTQEDLFDEENKSPHEQGTGDFHSPSTSKDDSHLKRTPSEELHTTPTPRDASHIIGTPSEDVNTTPISRDASHIIGTPSEDVHTTPTPRDASHIIGTPSETVSSLRFSGIVLANETSTSGSSASINVVYPSPEAYGPAPIIIPSTPTRPDTSNEELIELSDNDDMPRATLPEAPLKRKSTNTSDESEDVYRIPAWQQELNQLQKRKEEDVNTQDSWLKDNSGSKRSMSTSIDSTNPSSELSENLHKSSAELEESLSLQQQQPLMGSTTDESSRQSANSRPPSASIVGNGSKDRGSHSAPLLGDTVVRTVSRDTKQSSGSSQKGQASLPGDAAYDAKHPVTKEQSEEPHTTGQAMDFEKTSAEMKTQCDDRTRLNVNVRRHGDVVPEPDIEIIDDDYEKEEEGNKRDDAEAGMGVDPSQDWHLQLSPSQTQTQTQYSVAHSHRELGIKDVMSERDLSQIESKAVEEEDAHERKTTRLKGDGTTNVSRQGTPWRSTQAEDVDDDEVSMVIPESEKLGENKEDDGRGKQKHSDPDGGEKAMKEGSRGKFGEGMEDSVFLEGDAQLPDEGRLGLGQLGESDNPSPIAGFHLSVPKDGALLRPLSSMTPHLGKKGQWRTDGTPRHSTPIADETEGSSSQREVLSTADKETPKTTSKSSSALVVSAVIEMDSSESSEIPAFNLRNPTDCSELLKEAKESPSKRQKSVFSRVVEATKAAKSNTRTKKQTAPTKDKDPFSLTNPKTKLILGKKRNQQSLPQGDQPQGTTSQASKGKRGKEIDIEAEHGDEREAPDVAVEEDNSATIPLEYHGEDPRTECPDVEVWEEMTEEESEILKTRQIETQQYGATDEQEAEVEMEIEAEEEEIEEGKKEDARIEEVEEIPSKGQQQIFVSQERRRDPYEFTESQSNKTPTPMKTWARKEDTEPKEKLPSKNLSEVSSTKPTTEQPSTSAAVTLKTKRTPKGSRQNRGAKRKRPQDPETTEEEGDNVENPALNRTRTSPRKKASSTVRKVPKKRGKVLEKQQNKGQTAKVLTEKPSYVASPSMTQRIVQDPVPVAAERRLQASPASLELRQIPGHSPPTRQPPPWKIVRYKKVNITQRIKEVIEWGEIVETTVLEQVVNEEIIEKLEQDFMTPSPRSKTSSLTSGSLADISSLGSRTSSSVAGSLQKSSSVLSTGIQKSISLSSISEGNSSLDKTISLPGSEKTSPNVSGQEQSSSGRQLMSPGGVVPQRIPSRGTRASPGVSRNQDSSRVSPMDTQRRSFTGGTEPPTGISEQTSRTGQVRSSDVSPSALMLSRRMSSKGSKSSSDAEARMVPDGKDAQFVKPKRTPSRRRVSRTPEQAEQSTHEQPSNVRMDPPPELNLSEGWNVEQGQQSSEESEGIPCAQPRTEMERISSDETVEKSDADVGKQTTTTTGESLEEKVDDPEPSTSNQEGSSTRPTRGKRRSKTQITTPTRSSLEDTIIVQDEDGDQDVILSEPPQESMQQPSAGSASSTTTDSAQAFLVPGVRVFTRWMDGFYYPGTIKKEEKNNRLKIAFDDGDMRSVNSKDVIIKDWLSTGQSVMAESAEDGYNYPGIVIGYFRGSNPKDAGYFVETDNGQTTRYPRRKVILSKDQANLLLTSCPSSSSTGISDISLENLISGTRQRSRLRAPDGGGVVRTPSKVLGRTPRHDPSPAVTRSGGKRKATAEKQPAEGGDVSPRKKAKQLAKRLLTTVTASPDLGKQGIGIRRSPRKQPPSTSSTPGSPARGLFPATRGGPPSTPRTMEMLLGPLPKNKTLFKGMAFFLTQGEVKKRAKVDTSTSESELEDDADEAPFDKDHARKQIEAGGGVVLKDFDKSQKTQYKLSLVANTYCRTKKYFLALAFNIPCVSNLWIRDCSRTGKLQSHKAYLLPAGESVNGNIMEWKPNRRILSGLKIMVISSHIQVENTWRSILMVAGCHIVARFPTTNELNRGGIPFDCSVMVTDPSCPRHILHRAQQLDIPVVSVEWVMQSLINGVRMPYDSHDKFIWDYKEKLK